MEQLAEYRKRMDEKKKLLDKIKEQQAPKLDPPLTNPPFKGDLRNREIPNEPSWYKKDPTPEQKVTKEEENLKFRQKIEREEKEAKEREAMQQKEAVESEKNRVLAQKKKKEDLNSPSTVHSPIFNDPDCEKCKLRIRMLNSSIMTVQLQPTDHLSVVCEFIVRKGSELGDERYSKGILFSTMHPRRKFSLQEVSELTIEKAGLQNQTLIVDVNEGGFVVRSFSKEWKEAPLEPWKLKGDSGEEKDRFREKVRLEDISRKEKEEKQKKLDLERVRLQIEAQKKERKERGSNQGSNLSKSGL